MAIKASLPSINAGTVPMAASAHIAAIGARLERLPVTSYQKLIMLIVATAFFFDSMDLGAMTFLLGSIRGEFGLTTAQAGLLSSMSFLGMVFGAAGAGMLADRFGRMAIFKISMVLWGAGSILCGLSPDVTTLGLARILLGIGMGMEFPLAQSIISEMVPAHNRGRYIALLDGGWPVGFIASGLLSLAVLPLTSWRWVFLLEGVSAIFVFVLRRYVPESPRWLADRGHFERAEETMRGIEAQVAKRLGRALSPPAAALAAAPTPDRLPLLEIWTGPYAKRTLMVWTLWFFALLGFYGLMTWLSALLQQSGFAVVKSVYYTILISLAGIPGFLVAAWLLEAWGRKSTCVAALLGSAAMVYCYGSTTTLATLIGFGLAMQFCLFGMWAVLYAYTPELYPTRARATGSGWASAIGRIGSLIGPYVVGIVLPTVGQVGVFTLGAGAFAFAALAVLVLGEETRGRSLEEVSA